MVGDYSSFSSSHCCYDPEPFPANEPSKWQKHVPMPLCIACLRACQITATARAKMPRTRRAIGRLRQGGEELEAFGEDATAANNNGKRVWSRISGSGITADAPTMTSAAAAPSLTTTTTTTTTSYSTCCCCSSSYYCRTTAPQHPIFLIHAKLPSVSWCLVLRS